MRGKQAGGVFTAKKVMLSFVTFLFFMAYILIVSFLLSSSVVDYEAKTLLQAQLYASQLISNPECFAYKNADTGRIDEGIIDLNHFGKDVLNKCLVFQQPGKNPQTLPAQVTLTWTNNTDLELKTTMWKTMTTQTKTLTYDVLVHTDKGLEAAEFTFMYNPIIWTVE